LREHTSGDKNDESVAVSFGSPELSPSGFIALFFESQGFFDFLEFELYNFVII